MYQINLKTNRIEALDVKRFTDLNLTERNHLQEWIANQPNVLGEELLILQKEFDGFDDTRERLDLLALDKKGNLVVIENKLDDSGRDVVWQALKYASYCSSLTKSQIIEIYQNYLNRWNKGQSSENLICEFLDTADIDEVILNSGNQQRMIFVAAYFRKEVTSTALWLLSHDIQLQCFKVTPYALGEQYFLNVDQIIPVPEAKETMIGMNQKEAQEKSTQREMQSRHHNRLAFWEQTIEALKNSQCQLYQNISPSKDHWLAAGSGISGCTFNLIFGIDFLRVEFNLARSNMRENKFLFGELLKQKESIEKRFGEPLQWLPLETKKSSRLQFEVDVNNSERSQWPQSIEWLVKNIIRFEKAIRPEISSIATKLKPFAETNGEALEG